MRDNDLGGGQVDDEIMRYRDKLIRQAQNLPIWERKCLTVDEAAEYSGIGRKKLRSLLKKKNCPFALSDGFQNQIYLNTKRDRLHDVSGLCQFRVSSTNWNLVYIGLCKYTISTS